MFLHGCGMAVDGYFYGSWEKVTNSGWLEYATSNDLIIIQPQIEFSWSNPFDCFDMINYATPESATAYITNDGVQPRALKRMLDRLTEPLDSKHDYQSQNILAYNDQELDAFETWRFIQAFPRWIQEATFV